MPCSRASQWQLYSKWRAFTHSFPTTSKDFNIWPASQTHWHTVLFPTVTLGLQNGLFYVPLFKEHWSTIYCGCNVLYCESCVCVYKAILYILIYQKLGWIFTYTWFTNLLYQICLVILFLFCSLSFSLSLALDCGRQHGVCLSVLCGLLNDSSLWLTCSSVLDLHLWTPLSHRVKCTIILTMTNTHNITLPTLCSGNVFPDNRIWVAQPNAFGPYFSDFLCNLHSFFLPPKCLMSNPVQLYRLKNYF